jgi:hypothetical protein
MDNENKINVKSDEVIIITKNLMKIETGDKPEKLVHQYIVKYATSYIGAISVMLIISAYFVRLGLLDAGSTYNTISNYLYFALELLDKYFAIFLALLAIEIGFLEFVNKESELMADYYSNKKLLLILKASSLAIPTFIFILIGHGDRIIESVTGCNSTYIAQHYKFYIFAFIVSLIARGLIYCFQKCNNSQNKVKTNNDSISA